MIRSRTPDLSGCSLRAQWVDAGAAVSSSGPKGVVVAIGHWRVTAAAVSEQGPVRHQNQDAFRLVELDGRGLGLVIADGMGGQAGGGEAADAAVNAAEALLRDFEPEDGCLGAVVAGANDAVGAVRRQLGGSPGTTLVVAVVAEGRLFLAHAGDSRAYLIRSGAAQPLTADHSVTAERVRAGTLTPEEARTDPRRNYVTRALLGDPVEPELGEIELGAGDTILLCSDGLWAPLPDPRIAELAGGEPVEVAGALVSAALAAGSTDNVTAVVARLELEQ
jgi:PPM family protein phosphatase